MANNYFRFKEFTILQEVCAMKVCTDSCLFGAWVCESMGNKKTSNLLDIGTGTGLLSLMLAQKFTEVQCHCIEIEKDTSEEAKLNFENSIWSNRFEVFNQDFRTYSTNIKYDLIICNPPFYSNQLISQDNKRNAAMHSSEFSLEDLFNYSNSLIDQDGYLACLIPYNRTTETVDIIEKAGWYISKVAFVKQTSKHDFFRTMLLCKIESIPIEEEIITIKENQDYTKEFSTLLKDYYLFL